MEVSNVYQIGQLELSSYIFAYSFLPDIIAEKESVVSELYQDISPTITCLNEGLGVIQAVSVNVEDMAIMIIERKAEYDRMIQRYEGKAKTFEQAMNYLTDRERDVIFSYYFHKNGNDLGLSDEYYNQLLHDAEIKLCGAISELQQNKFQLIKLEEHQQKAEIIAEWKKAN